MRSTVISATLLALLASQAAAWPKAPSFSQAPQIRALLECRAETDGAKRLSCFDTAASALTASIDKRDVVVVDRAQVNEAKRSLFGFNLPSIGLLGASSNDKEVDKQIAGTVRSARTDASGNWIVTLDSGAVWEQSDERGVAQRPNPGDPIIIVRGTLGSYFMRIGKQPGVKARRVG